MPQKKAKARGVGRSTFQEIKQKIKKKGTIIVKNRLFETYGIDITVNRT